MQSGQGAWASESSGKGKGKTWNTWKLPYQKADDSWDNNSWDNSWDNNKSQWAGQQGGLRPASSTGPAQWQSFNNGGGAAQVRAPTSSRDLRALQDANAKGGGKGPDKGPDKGSSWGAKGAGKGTGPAAMMPAPRMPGYTGPQALSKAGGGFLSPPPPPLGTPALKPGWTPGAPAPKVQGPSVDARAAATQLASALVHGFRPGADVQPPPTFRPGPGQTLPPPGGPMQLLPQRPPVRPPALGYGQPPSLGAPHAAIVPFQRPPAMGAPAFLALPGLGQDAAALAQAPPPMPIDVKKPRIFLLLTRLSPSLEESHMQQILEQCGEVCGWRRGRDATGVPLSFGFVQLGSAEAAWKASTCLGGRKLCGQEVKVLVEEHAEKLIANWRAGQQVALRLSSPADLDFELERIAVSCKAQIDVKVEEIYGPEACDGAAGAAAAQRRKELRDREALRVGRTRKRKAWREAEFANELGNVEREEKRLRTAEREKDAADCAKEGTELQEKAEQEEAVAKMEEAGIVPSAAMLHPEGRKLVELVNRVQAEPRADLFKMDIDVNFLRNEKILENKMRPWLESKIDTSMGGCQSDLVEYILRRVNGNSAPEELISDLSRYLDDHTDTLVERLWRMIGFELLVGGAAPSLLKKEK